MTLYTFGRGKDGRLGHDDGCRDHAGPAAVAALDGTLLRHVALGNCHGGAITDEGEVYMWGGGAFGELGLGDDVEESPRPRLLAALRGRRVVSLACGFYHTACVTDDGVVWTWDGARWPARAWGGEPTPVRGMPRHVPCTSVACGHHATLALGEDGGAYQWERSVQTEAQAQAEAGGQRSA